MFTDRLPIGRTKIHMASCSLCTWMHFIYLFFSVPQMMEAGPDSPEDQFLTTAAVN